MALTRSPLAHTPIHLQSPPYITKTGRFLVFHTICEPSLLLYQSASNAPTASLSASVLGCREGQNVSDKRHGKISTKGTLVKVSPQREHGRHSVTYKSATCSVYQSQIFHEIMPCPCYHWSVLPSSFMALILSNFLRSIW